MWKLHLLLGTIGTTFIQKGKATPPRQEYAMMLKLQKEMAGLLPQRLSKKENR